jgi:hypothetical protein
MEAQEIEPLSFLSPVRWTMRVLAALGSAPAQPAGEPAAPAGLGLLPGSAHHHQVIAVAHQHPVPARLPYPVQPVQVDVAEQWVMPGSLAESRSPPAAPATLSPRKSPGWT